MIALFLLACASAHKLPTATLDVDGHTVTVEIADDDAEREKGLMHRESMGTDEGMLFVYGEERPRSFWMKDTPLPLTIAYVDRAGKIVKILDMTPFDTGRYQSLFPAMYALEMNQGWFKANDVVEGDKITGLPKLSP